MNDRIFIVAGHVSEYTHWVKKNLDRFYAKNKSMSLSNFVYVSGPEVFRGWNEVHGVFTGTYRDRPDIRDIVREIRRINGIHPSQMIIPDMYIGRGVSVI
jgi:hypothetical protein